MSDEYDHYTSDDDDESIGPLPLLKRNRSLVVRRPSDDREERKHGSRGQQRYYQSPREIRRKSNDSASRLITASPPRRARSLEPGQEISVNLPVRRASMQPGAATRGSLSKRPDPPEQIRPVNCYYPLPQQLLQQERKQGILRSHVVKNDLILYDPLYRAKSLDIPKRPRRTSSMPVFGQGSSNNTTRNANKVSRNSNNSKLVDGMFAARRSKSIAKSFAKTRSGGRVDNDVWVERMVVRDGKDPQVFFKSVYSQEIKSEPPTGAVNVIYMDELVKVQHLRRKKNRQSSQQRNDKCQEEMVATSYLPPIAKKRSLWGKGTKKKSGTSQTGPRKSWKSSIGLGSGNRKKKHGMTSA